MGRMGMIVKIGARAMARGMIVWAAIIIVVII